MKLIKTYEGRILDELNAKSEEYSKYNDKYIICECRGQLYLGKFLKIILNGYFAKIELYEYDDDYDDYVIFPLESIHLGDLTILKVFDNMKDAKEDFIEIETAKKYNL